MAPDFENKVDRWTKGVKALKRLWAEFKGLVYAILVGVLGFGYILKNPDIIMKKVEQTFIHNEVIEATKHNYADSPLRRRDSIYIAGLEKRLKTTENVGALALKLARDNDELIKRLDIRVDSVDTQTQYNTIVNSIQTDLSIEMMEKKENNCNWVYYKSHSQDDWKGFVDRYNCKVPYSLDLRSDCRAFYTPIWDDKKIAN